MKQTKGDFSMQGEKIIASLSKNEMLVYRFLKKNAINSCELTLKEIVDQISEQFKDEIPLRKVRDEDRYESLFSESSVHRAIKKMELENILQVTPSREKTKPNRIVFLGEPNEQHLYQKLMDLSDEMHLVSNRLKTIHAHSDESIHQLIIELSQTRALLEQEKIRSQQLSSRTDELYENNQELIEQLQRLNTDCITIPFSRIKSQSKSNDEITVIIQA